jgi:hypothetical protein
MSADAHARFREVQRFRQPWLWVVLLLPLAFVAVGSFLWARDEPIPWETWALIGGVTLLALGWFAVLRLTTEVEDEALVLQFVPLWKKKRIPYASIRSVEARTYRPLREYGGWGIRYGRQGGAYNVSGDRGVQLQLDDGRRFLVGSQRPDELARAISERVASGRQPSSS